MAARDRIVPIIVASPLFLQNLDTSVMATALPSIAQSLQVPALHLNLAITSYLLSLAVFLPVSGWLADRFGARRVFCWAIAAFSLGSALCGAAQSLEELVLFRILQGMGGAMMVPVGRLILLRSVPAERLVSAMVWFTVPPVIGRMIGPLFGGTIVTFSSWRWIFLVNIPFGLLAMLMAWLFVDAGNEHRRHESFDLTGFVLLGLGLSALLGAIELAGKSMVPAWALWVAAGVGCAALLAYVAHSRRLTNPIIDLAILRVQTYRATVIGGMPLRIAIGASPFLLPLLMQLGFGFSPLASGLLTVATAVGALGTRVVMAQSIRRFGFRPLLISCTVLTSLFYISYGQFRADTPHVLMFITMMLGGLVNSMAMVAIQTLGFSDISKARMSHATALSSMGQQLSLSLGVILGASVLTLASHWNGNAPGQLHAADFSPAFLVVGLLTMLSLLSFVRLSATEGQHLR